MSIKTLPELGESRPPIVFKKVVLPEPDGPTIAVNSPFLKLMLTSFYALISWSACLYSLEIFLVSITFIIINYSDLIASAGSSLSALLAGNKEEISVTNNVRIVILK